MQFSFKFFGICLYICSVAHGASILALFSSLSFADQAVFRGYVSLLASRGHHVVIMTPFSGQFLPAVKEKIIELDVGQESAPFWEEYRQLVTNVEDPYTRLRDYSDLSVKLAIAQLKSKQITALFINPNIRFDLVVTEADVPLLYAVAERYKAPHIAITTSSGKIHHYESKNMPVHPILHLDVNALSYENATLWQKITSLNRHFGTKREYNAYLTLSEKAAQGIFKLEKSLKDIEHDIDMLFVANNPALTGNRPSGPSVVYTDRLQILPGNTLHEDLKAVLDSATKGAIYFSLGATQPAEQLSSKFLNTVADAFREMPYKVLWKIGNTTKINKPDNVLAQDWFPQQEILAHPNLKAFITNGGPRSLEEALFYEVPIIGIPTVKTRKVFIEQVTKHGAGEILDPHYLDNKTLHATVIRVVRDLKYKKAVIKLKNAIFDPIVSGPDHAVLWTEHVIRNGGAKHLHSPSSSFMEAYLLDVLCFIVILITILSVISYFVVRRALRRIRKYVIERRGLDGKYKAL